MTNHVKNMLEIVENQRYGAYYLFQIIPGLGAIVSIPTALISGLQAIAKVAQAVLQGRPYFKPKDAKNMDHIKFPMQDARDLGIIFANNVANICTLGILNCVFVCKALNNVVLNKNFD